MSDEATFPIARASLIALFTESLVFGAFTVLYAIAIWILLYREKRRSKSTLNKLLFATSTVMWVLSVAHLCIDVQRALQAFVVEGGKPDGALLFYSTLNNPTLVAKDGIYITMTIVADSFVTYRLFVVWNHAWYIIVLPVILLIATAVAGYGACAEIGMVKGVGAIFAANLQPWIRAFFSLSLTTNLLTTILIAARIVWMNRRVKSYRAGGGHWEVVETLVQSAAIYSAALASLLGTYLAGSNAQYVCLDILQPLIGVVFTLIIIRVGLGYTMNEVSAKGGSEFQGQTIGGTDYNLRPVAINVSVSRTHDRQSLEVYDSKDRTMTDIESGTSRAE
ncbi:hypothetical protein BD309DRAFT_958987 [Dichomitus squalens]|uniref:Uncharacterized protein n=1 Tax=Dichomitus squalens TaxID=114155 RepID=A0A4Q9PJF6_9APHY|nr:hypothetical protein BD309DRAFT_958987 [Dichomitus squalens]TBU54229.1 hypothetical protein BD310DRAFT_936303 [Dichomitus squalens]